jgi:hypothetical protein
VWRYCAATSCFLDRAITIYKHTVLLSVLNWPSSYEIFRCLAVISSVLTGLLGLLCNVFPLFPDLSYHNSYSVVTNYPAKLLRLTKVWSAVLPPSYLYLWRNCDLNYHDSWRHCIVIAADGAPVGFLWMVVSYGISWIGAEIPRRTGSYGEGDEVCTKLTKRSRLPLGELFYGYKQSFSNNGPTLWFLSNVQTELNCRS